MADTNSKVFSAMESVAADNTFVDLFKTPEETTTETREDIKTWKNFENVLGDDFPKDKKNVLKKLWVEGGRPHIDIMAGLKKVEVSPRHTQWYKHRAHYDTARPFEEEARDTMSVAIQDPVDDFMAELSHAFQFRRRPDEDFDAWEKRRDELSHKVGEEHKHFGDPGKYGTRKLVPSKIQTNPDVEVSMEMRKMFPISLEKKIKHHKLKNTTGNVVYDPETRLGRGGEKPTVEFEAHSIIEDSLWQDYQNRFGEEWGQRGKGWRPYEKKWVKQSKAYTDKQIYDDIDNREKNISKLIKEGYLE